MSTTVYEDCDHDWQPFGSRLANSSGPEHLTPLMKCTRCEVVVTKAMLDMLKSGKAHLP